MDFLTIMTTNVISSEETRTNIKFKGANYFLIAYEIIK